MMQVEVAGLLIVDEAGGWLNARTWQGKDRDAIIDWLTQSRKRRWDVILIAQAPVMLDKQVREAVCETVVRIRRLDRWKILGVAMPRVHIAIVRYGLEQSAPVIERWIYRGIEAQQCFGSYRLFGADSAHYSTLTAWHTKFRYLRLPVAAHRCGPSVPLAVACRGLSSYRDSLCLHFAVDRIGAAIPCKGDEIGREHKGSLLYPRELRT